MAEDLLSSPKPFCHKSFTTFKGFSTYNSSASYEASVWAFLALHCAHCLIPSNLLQFNFTKSTKYSKLTISF